MSLPKKYRPAWKGMGWWRWLSILLIVYSLVLIVPYVLYGGGSHEIVGTRKSDKLGGCDFELGVIEQEGVLRFTMKADASCVRGFAQPTLELLNPSKVLLKSIKFRGNPNALTARLPLKDIQLADIATLVMRSETSDGSPLMKRWPFTDFRP